MKTVLVLGFYDRKNAGDEMYKHALPLIFEEANFIFKCMDDIKEIPCDVDFVICGGGDIINSYFMEKAKKILATYTGRVYAFSVGIPYDNERKYLHLFDHVFVRSKGDFVLACEEIGIRNVTYLPDATFVFAERNAEPIAERNAERKIGLCLAQPAFFKNTNETYLINQIVDSISLIVSLMPGTRIYLLSFNYSEANQSESDFIINEKLYDRLLEKKIPVEFPRDLNCPKLLFQKIEEMDVVVGMRYHSILFSLMCNKHVVPMFCSSKVMKIVSDYEDYIPNHIKLETDRSYKPIHIPCEQLIDILSRDFQPKPQIAIDWKVAKDIMFKFEKTAEILVKKSNNTFDSVMTECRKNLMTYLKLSNDEYTEFLLQKKPVDLKEHTAMDFSRMLCYSITKSLQSPYVWGLSVNIFRDDFCLYEAIKFIWEDYSRNMRNDDQYYPYIYGMKRNVFIDINGIDFQNYHRSGWSYAIGGLMNLQAENLMRKSSMFVDTYVDRSFHWGLDTLKTIDKLPYKTPWIGFIHHTFNQYHSNYNCVNLLKCELFLESLKSCKGLIALSDYLTQNLKKALETLNIAIPVKTIYHPMEFVEDLFTLENFWMNDQRKLVQIGAWLRNPYSIYELSLWGNKLKLQKAALKGKEMDNYFKPPFVLEKVKNVLLKNNSTNEDRICRANDVNKYCDGLWNMIERNDSSVIVIEKLSNSDYDKLLSENIVFLNLVDCSAVNTVLECLVRNTVIIVNRHPALEEILGIDYPGFYETLTDATIIINHFGTIALAYYHLKSIDKTKYMLRTFVSEFQNFVAAT